MSTDRHEDPKAWFMQARFGMFIHWGVYAIPGRGEWVMYREHIPAEEYAKLADQFNPRHYKPRDWVALAQDAGMRYMVLTARHHDGFCLWDTKTTDFSAPRTAAKRDLLAEYVDACHSMGMRMGFYYSLADWRFPGGLYCYPRDPATDYEPMMAQAHSQIRELLTNYGKVDMLWYDGGHPGDIWRGAEMDAMVRALQPEIVTNGGPGTGGDFVTHEQNTDGDPRPWEACVTMNDCWGYVPSEKGYKTVMQLIGTLVTCASKGGNLLLNVGPDPEGRIPAAAADRLRSIGKWMRVNGEAIYGSTRTVLRPPSEVGNATQVGNRQFLHIHAWQGSTLAMAWVGNRVTRARVLATGTEAQIEQKGDRVWLHGLPQYAPDPDISVIELEIEGEPRYPELRFHF
ncbi:MAG TPA: alpha-L-fucosidase [Candidatus Latescibacteria bacterium]|nr:alpha-L-fucosidase [Candidatus Latescibacterota bacterium]HOS64340.1 alpha-L-fucosidase [Candidatus Latescibacterota bacterium]HPK75757.1 alpha-L-fucosidase [Candidatus Latescibacterota bacterium]